MAYLHILQETSHGHANGQPWHDTVLPWHLSKVCCIGPRTENNTTQYTHTHTHTVFLPLLRGLPSCLDNNRQQTKTTLQARVEEVSSQCGRDLRLRTSPQTIFGCQTSVPLPSFPSHSLGCIGPCRRRLAQPVMDGSTERIWRVINEALCCLL